MGPRVGFAQTLGQTEHLEKLSSLASGVGGVDMETRYAALCGLARGDLDHGIETMVGLMAEDPGDADPVPALQSVLENRRGAKFLSDRLAGVTLHPLVVARIAEFQRTTTCGGKRFGRGWRSTADSSAPMACATLADAGTTCIG